MRAAKNLGADLEAALSATPLTIAELEGSNRSGVDLYLQIHDTDEAIADMTDHVYTLPVPSGMRVPRTLPGGGVRVTNPRFIWSTAEHTVTAYAGSAADLAVYAWTPNPAAA